jgi:adenosylmethionine-8-amino-7-oxononanoate aminotransferase
LAGLRQLSTLENVGDVRGLGLMCGLELVEDKATKKSFPAARKVGARLYQECARRGLISRIKEDIFMLAPAFVISDADLDACVNILGEAIPIAVKA